MKTVIGIDGGATSTRALVVDETGRTVAYRTAGGSNPRTAGIEQARRNLAAVTQGHRGAAAFLGMAGVGELRERKLIIEVVVELGLAPTEMVGVDHDIRIALAGGLAGAPGIVVIAGTGAACFGLNVAGETGRAGGWDWLVDNHGGAHRMALAGLEAVLRASDGRSPATALSGALPDLAMWRKLPEAEVAALAPVVLAAAEDGDVVAREIIARQADELACAVAAVARQLKQAGPVTYTGSLLLKSASYRAAFTTAVQRRLPGAVVVAPQFSPVVGAVLLAWQRVGWPVTAAVLANLREFRAENF